MLVIGLPLPELRRGAATVISDLMKTYSLNVARKLEYAIIYRFTLTFAICKDRKRVYILQCVAAAEKDETRLKPKTDVIGSSDRQKRNKSRRVS